MKIKTVPKLKSQTKGLLIIPLFEEDLKTPPKTLPESIVTQFSVLKDNDFLAKEGEKTTTYINDENIAAKIVFVGLGKKKEYDAVKSLHSGGHVGAVVRTAKKKSVTIFPNKDQNKYLSAFVEGLFLNIYKLEKLKTTAKDDHLPEEITLYMEEKLAETAKIIDRATIIASSVSIVKDLVNHPSNIVDMEYFTKTAKQIAKENGYKFTVINEARLRKEGWGGLLAVNQGTESQGRCLVLEYKGGNAKEQPIVLVGKGVLFDTGGYNLKPTNFIETMHYDMAGAATVLGVFSALKAMNIKQNVVGIMPLAENLISSKAYRPADIITMLNGKTVEITNTDAEGRLILADAITHAQSYQPREIFTMATLTGAVVAALGDRFAGIMGNNEKIQTTLAKIGKETDENVWSFPLLKHYSKKMESKVADLRNFDMESGRYAGTVKAAGFLEYFIEERPWCHMDIAGTAFTHDPAPYQTAGATGYGVRLLLEYLAQSSK